MIRRLLTVSLLMGALSVAACAGGGEGEEFMDYEGMKAEYLRKVQDYEFPLPQGIAFPDEPPRPTEPTVYQRGNGIVWADNFWRCAWMSEWLKSRDDDPARAAVAMGWLERFPETEFMRKYTDPPGDPNWMDKVIDPAKLGDLTTFRELMASCPEAATRGSPQ